MLLVLYVIIYIYILLHIMSRIQVLQGQTSTLFRVERVHNLLHEEMVNEHNCPNEHPQAAKMV